MNLAHKSIVAPSAMVAELAGVLKALAQAKSASLPAAVVDASISAAAQAIATSLSTGEKKAVLLGNFAAQHPDAAQIEAYAQAIADLAGARLGHFGEAANSVGAHLVGACSPKAAKSHAADLLQHPRRAYLLLNVEPELDSANPMAAVGALNGADMVVALSPFKSKAMDYADVLLPIAPFTETAGSFINADGSLQSFNGVVKPLGDTRPAWKVLRVLGNLLGLKNFDFDTPEAVRSAALGKDFAADTLKKLDNRTSSDLIAPKPAPGKALDDVLERIADVPIYFADPLVRRAASLQRTRDANAPSARLHSAQLAKLGIANGEQMLVGAAMLKAKADDKVPLGCVRVAAAHPATVAASSMFGSINVEKL